MVRRSGLAPASPPSSSLLPAMPPRSRSYAGSALLGLSRAWLRADSGPVCSVDASPPRPASSNALDERVWPPATRMEVALRSGGTAVALPLPLPDAYRVTSRCGVAVAGSSVTPVPPPPSPAPSALAAGAAAAVGEPRERAGRAASLVGVLMAAAIGPLPLAECRRRRLGDTAAAGDATPGGGDGCSVEAAAASLRGDDVALTAGAGTAVAAGPPSCRFGDAAAGALPLPPSPCRPVMTRAKLLSVSESSQSLPSVPWLLSPSPASPLRPAGAAASGSRAIPVVPPGTSGGFPAACTGAATESASSSARSAALTAVLAAHISDDGVTSGALAADVDVANAGASDGEVPERLPVVADCCGEVWMLNPPPRADTAPSAVEEARPAGVAPGAARGTT